MNRDAIVVKGGGMAPEEISMYVEHLRSQHGREPDELTIEIVKGEDGEYVDLNSTYHTPPFQRIRRITGYLVGDLSRFNNGKRKEEADRVKHGTAGVAHMNQLEYERSLEERLREEHLMSLGHAKQGYSQIAEDAKKLGFTVEEMEKFTSIDWSRE